MLDIIQDGDQEYWHCGHPVYAFLLPLTHMSLSCSLTSLSLVTFKFLNMSLGYMGSKNQNHFSKVFLGKGKINNFLNNVD